LSLPNQPRSQLENINNIGSHNKLPNIQDRGSHIGRLNYASYNNDLSIHGLKKPTLQSAISNAELISQRKNYGNSDQL